jgi:hypothetical protein
MASKPKRSKAPPSHLSKEVISTAVVGKHIDYALALAAQNHVNVDVLYSEPRRVAKRPDTQLVLFVGADGVVTKAL